MKTLKDIITERLHITKKTNLSKEYSFDEFKDLVSSELNTIISDDCFNEIKRYYDNLGDVIFIDVTDDINELDFYQRKIEKIDDYYFDKYYCIHDIKTFFNYINNDIRPASTLKQIRFGYVEGDDRHDISKTHIFKLKQ